MERCGTIRRPKANNAIDQIRNVWIIETPNTHLPCLRMLQHQRHQHDNKHQLQQHMTAMKKFLADPTAKEGIKEHLAPDCNLKSKTCEALSALPFKPKFKWVKGHQTPKCDRDGKEMLQSREAIVDNRADVLAGEHLQAMRSGTRAPSEAMPHLPTSTASLTIKGKRATSNMCTELREGTHGENVSHHIVQCNNWSEDTFAPVDWDACETAMKKQRNKSTARPIKHVHDWLPAGHQQQQPCKDRDPKCPT